MARKAERPAAVAAQSWRQYVLPSLMVTFVVLAALVTLVRWEKFITQDARFVLRPPELGERISADIHVTGLTRTPLSQVRAAFIEDEGRSVYHIPLEKRREQILDLKWVRQATVTRIWPNRVEVRVVERVPAAFVQITPDRRGVTPGVQLIDADGVLLPVIDRQRFHLPLLTGIREKHTPSDRAARVRLMDRFLKDLGPLGRPVSEIDLSEPDNVKVVYPVDGRALTLVLGGEDWKARMDKFLRYYPDIQKRMPDAIKLDLRLPDRITAMQTDDNDHAQ